MVSAKDLSFSLFSSLFTHSQIPWQQRKLTLNTGREISSVITCPAATTKTSKRQKYVHCTFPRVKVLDVRERKCNQSF